jgi:hypothetical protein
MLRYLASKSSFAVFTTAIAARKCSRPSKGEAHKGSDKRDTFDAAVSDVERDVSYIASTAQKNLDGCAGVLDSVRGLSQEVVSTATALQINQKRSLHLPLTIKMLALYLNCLSNWPYL